MLSRLIQNAVGTSSVASVIISIALMLFLGFLIMAVPTDVMYLIVVLIFHFSNDQ